MVTKIQNSPHIFDQQESVIPFHRAHKFFPFPISPPTLQRWIRRGISTPQGHVILESTTVGGRRFTSVEAIERFIRAQQGQSTAGVNNGKSIPANNGMTPSERKREMKRLGLHPQSDTPVARTPGRKIV